MRIAVVLAAAGRGRRFGGDLPKQYRLLRGEPVLRMTARRFLSCPEIGPVQTVIGPEDRKLYDLAMRPVEDARALPPVIGGATRQESTRAGLEALVGHEPEIVLIHDAARPLISRDAILRATEAATETGGAIVATPVADTLKRACDGAVIETVDRAGLWRAQTPQAFRFRNILDAHRDAEASGVSGLTDDAAMFERVGGRVRIAPGAEDNIKITSQTDLDRIEAILADRAGVGPGERAERRMAFVTGTGFDVHGFEPGDHVWLCGIKLPHDAALKGHSDADVGLHALTDALLGAISAGDIGTHFPPTDARWRGADSQMFLRHAADLATAAGGRIAHVDVTLICERPKLGPHKQAMIDKIAGILRLAPRRVSVKATTTEGLGFTGRREGIAALASATVALCE